MTNPATQTVQIIFLTLGATVSSYALALVSSGTVDPRDDNRAILMIGVGFLFVFSSLLWIGVL